MVCGNHAVLRFKVLALSRTAARFAIIGVRYSRLQRQTSSNGVRSAEGRRTAQKKPAGGSLHQLWKRLGVTLQPMSLVSGNYIRAPFETDTRRECHFRGHHCDSVLVRCCDHLVAFRQIVARLWKTRYASWELTRWSSIHRNNLKLVPFLSLQGTKCRVLLSP